MDIHNFFTLDFAVYFQMVRTTVHTDSQKKLKATLTKVCFRSTTVHIICFAGSHSYGYIYGIFLPPRTPPQHLSWGALGVMGGGSWGGSWVPLVHLFCSISFERRLGRCWRQRQDPWRRSGQWWRCPPRGAGGGWPGHRGAGAGGLRL